MPFRVPVLRGEKKQKALVEDCGAAGGGGGDWLCHGCGFKSHALMPSCEVCALQRGARPPALEDDGGTDSLEMLFVGQHEGGLAAPWAAAAARRSMHVWSYRGTVQCAVVLSLHACIYFSDFFLHGLSACDVQTFDFNTHCWLILPSGRPTHVI